MEQKLYPWGDGPFASGPITHAVGRRSEPVATAEPNGYGLFDMCENVHEWCSDWFDPLYYAVSPSDNPRGPESGTRRASRGGSVAASH
jgi:formylglycine-generating enzyme required for sulfatase activity